MRHRVLDFRPPTGHILCTQVKFDREVMGEISHPQTRCRKEYIEAWTKVTGGPVTSLELISEVVPNGGKAPGTQSGRAGYWLFCGDRFVRVVGLPTGEGLVAGACCGSIAQLETIMGGARVVQAELEGRYEACVGKVEAPGRLRVQRAAWKHLSREGEWLYDARANIGGSIAVSPSEVAMRLPSGVEQRWRIRDWGFDPFTLKAGSGSASSSCSSSKSSSSEEAKPAAPAPAAAKKASESSSASSSDSSSKDRGRRRRKRDRKKDSSESRAHSRRRRHKHRHRRRRPEETAGKAEVKAAALPTAAVPLPAACGTASSTPSWLSSSPWWSLRSHAGPFQRAAKAGRPA